MERQKDINAYMELGKEEHEENHSRKGVRIEIWNQMDRDRSGITPARECVLKFVRSMKQRMYGITPARECVLKHSVLFEFLRF